jgi:lipopolysaccharide biosynthesis glycosyltransferase
VTLHVAFVTDRPYVPWCATALLSCVDAHPAGALHVHVAHDGSLTAEDVRLLRSMAGAAALTVHPVDPSEVEHLPAVDRFGHVVWLRFLLPELLPDVDRLLYLDADTFVVADFMSLAELDLAGAPLAAVQNVATPTQQDRLAALGIAEPSHTLNSGVLLMDLARMRAEDLLGQVVLTTAERADELQWPDQDVLNLVCAGRWQALHPRYNVQNSFFEWGPLAERVLGPSALAEALAQPAVVHFEGPSLCKPWHVLCRHPWRDRYLAVLARTPWSEVELEDDRWSTRAIGRLPARWQLSAYRRLVRRRGRRDAARQRRSVAP